jgi:hypothetical protein
MCIVIHVEQPTRDRGKEMKITKKVGKQASDIYTNWLNAGVPQDVTKYEAFKLTSQQLFLLFLKKFFITLLNKIRKYAYLIQHFFKIKNNLERKF